MKTKLNHLLIYRILKRDGLDSYSHSSYEIRYDYNIHWNPVIVDWVKKLNYIEIYIWEENLLKDIVKSLKKYRNSFPKKKIPFDIKIVTTQRNWKKDKIMVIPHRIRRKNNDK